MDEEDSGSGEKRVVNENSGEVEHQVNSGRGQQENNEDFVYQFYSYYDSNPNNPRLPKNTVEKIRQDWKRIHSAIKKGKTTNILPATRITKIVKHVDEECARTMKEEVPNMLSKAVELFTCELIHRSYANTAEEKRKVIKKEDVSNAIAKNEIFDFLVDIVPSIKHMESGGDQTLYNITPFLLGIAEMKQ